jgi:hypothetical protein
LRFRFGGNYLGGRSTWIALALVSRILVKAAGHKPAGWDDFWNWLPSAAYEYNQNSFPWPDLPPSLSIFPGYPQSMPLMIAAASFIGCRFLESAGPVINVLLLAGSCALFAEALIATLVRHGQLRAEEMPLSLIAGAVSITVLLNPGLDGSVVLSSYADCGTMVAVGALGLFGVETAGCLYSVQTAPCWAAAKRSTCPCITPEYNYSIPGALKNAIDWVSRLPDQPFKEKPVAIQSATGGPLGGARMQYHLRQAMIFLNAFSFGTPEIFVGQAPTKFDEKTLELKDEITKKLVAQQLAGFAKFIERVKA